MWRSLNAVHRNDLDSADSLAIGALALPPSDPTVYIGTGEFNGCADCFWGGTLSHRHVNTTPSLVGPISPSQTVEIDLQRL